MQIILFFNYALINKFIDTLLRPFDWLDNFKIDKIDYNLLFQLKEIYALIKEVQPILEKEKS